MIYYHPKHFELEELVPPETFKLLGEKAWWLLDTLILWTIDQMRERYNRTFTVNNWKSGGPFDERGWRPATTKEGKDHSQHRYGRAIDGDVEGMPADEVRADILTHPDDPAFQYITCLETGISWVHLDRRNWNREKNGILQVKR